jgi:nicotinamidase-related amidase
MTTALVCIDIQSGFHDSFWGKRNNPNAEVHMEELLQIFRDRKLPIFHIQHISAQPDSPLRPHQPGVEFMDFAKPIGGELIIQKNVNSAFIGTTLESELRTRGIQRLIMIGFTSDHCVSTSVRMAGNLGFQVLVSEGAVCAFDRKDHLGNLIPAVEIHNASLASLHGEFATVYEHEVLLEILKNLSGF